MPTLTASQMLEVNRRAPGTYSKAQHSAARNFRSWDVIRWNSETLTDEQYSQAEHRAAAGGSVTAFEMLFWNRRFPNAGQYTRAEHEAALGFEQTAFGTLCYMAQEARWWNEDLPKAEQYPVETIANLWNRARLAQGS